MAGGRTWREGKRSMLGVSVLVLSAVLSACSDPGSVMSNGANIAPTQKRGVMNALPVAREIDPNVSVGTEGLKQALAAVDRKDARSAMAIASTLPDIDKLIVEWMLIRRDVPGLSSAFISDFANSAPDWPSAAIMRKRAEAAVLREGANPSAVISAFGRMPPATSDGVKALARAYAVNGQGANAAQVIGTYWRDQLGDSATDQQFLQEFRPVLGARELAARWHMLMYADRMSQAEPFARLLGGDYLAMTMARAAVVNGQGNADQRLAAVSGTMQSDPIYLLTRAEQARKANQPGVAARLLMQAPAELNRLVDPNAWWVERRITSRDLIEAGDPTTAYQLVASQRGGDDKTQAEAAFHAGWYALRFLRDPNTAIGHFQQLAQLATQAGTRARAAYWLGRAYEAAGQSSNANSAYSKAAEEPSSYYGQLAHVALGKTSLFLPPVPAVSDADRAALSRDVLGRALARLVAAGYDGDTQILYSEIARRATTNGSFTILSQMAEAADSNRAAMQIGIIGVQRGFQTDRLAFPVNAIPDNARIDNAVERPLVFALSRQESNFDPQVVSSAGAVGLMQLMPATAHRTAKDIGLPWNQARLKDPAYNATLGSAHLKGLLADWNGSYILTIASYNAGKSKVAEWVRRFGDPRDPRVDPIDWIESIPYGETRGYVQKVLENLQVYRTRLNGTPLAITRDLKRGS